MQNSLNPSAKSLLLAGAMIVATAASCSRPDEAQSGREPVFPVRGTVLVDGQPAENALVVFHAVGASETETLRPNGRTAADGSFALGTYESSDGAPAGDYVATVIWPETASGPMPDPDSAPDRLRGRYAVPQRSPLRARVEQTENELPSFELK